MLSRLRLFQWMDHFLSVRSRGVKRGVTQSVVAGDRYVAYYKAPYASADGQTPLDKGIERMSVFNARSPEGVDQLRLDVLHPSAEAYRL